MAVTPQAPQDDVASNRPPDSATDDIKTKLARTTANTAQFQKSDLNTQPPTPQYDPFGRRIYETAPTQLKRLFGSPLAETGKWSIGPNGERQVGDGWGSPRNFSYDPHVNTNSRHLGLDFFALYGENLLACGDGVITFAGWQAKNNPAAQSLDGAKQGPNGSIVTSSGTQVAAQSEIGFGGICVFLQMNGDFAGYTCEYYHMSQILVNDGAKVSQGQVIGKVGNSGVAGIGPHLHYQVIYSSGKQRCIVNPTAIVPNRRPGFADSTNSYGGSPTTMPSSAPAGVQYQASQASNVISTWDRSTNMQNQTVPDMRQRIADFTAFLTNVTSVQQTALDGAVASFNTTPAKVILPMTFDFSKGVWVDNGNPV
jgi:murein DD-endopeptidase MepM/ murein hydrolase activator NlpD